MSLSLRIIKPEQTAALRQSLLRPHQSIEEMQYPNDKIQGATHFGAFLDEQLVGIVSIYPETQSGEIGQKRVWRLRGMATTESVRGKGYGKELVNAAMKYAAEQGGETMWCNARVTACGFYLKFGFQQEAKEFHIPGIGPHYIMSIPLIL